MTLHVVNSPYLDGAIEGCSLGLPDWLLERSECLPGNNRFGGFPCAWKLEGLTGNDK